MRDISFRSEVLSGYGASDLEKGELLLYNENLFDHSRLPSPLKLPLEDEAFVAAWRRYEKDARVIGAFQVLKETLVQLSFPIRKGISASEGFRAVVLRGVSPDAVWEAYGLDIQHPEQITFFLNPTAAGHIPVITTGERADFESLVRALAMRNEPLDVPASMGATIVFGYNNWERIRSYRKKWESTYPQVPDEAKWQKELARIMPLREMYQDQFIILSEGPYSAVSATDMGLSEEEWKSKSLIIRREHESTHYATRRMFQSAQNHLLDEIIADYFGIVAAAGSYRADWFLMFMGLEQYPRYRKEGRLEIYRGKPPLSPGSFKILQTLVKRAAENLEYFHSRYEKEIEGPRGRFLMFMTLTRLTLEELASERSEEIIKKAMKDVRSKICLEDLRESDLTLHH